MMDEQVLLSTVSVKFPALVPGCTTILPNTEARPDPFLEHWLVGVPCFWSEITRYAPATTARARMPMTSSPVIERFMSSGP